MLTKIISYNVKGLNGAAKRKDGFMCIQENKLHVEFLLRDFNPIIMETRRKRTRVFTKRVSKKNVTASIFKANTNTLSKKTEVNQAAPKGMTQA